MLANHLEPVFFEKINHDLDAEFKLSAKTSIARKTPSAPLKQLIQQGLLPNTASCLNFGKGRYDTDSAQIREIAGHCVDYDYTHCRTNIFGSHFGFVYAGYVVNTLPIEARHIVYDQLAHVTALDGICYIAARSDGDRGIKGEPYQDGVRTRIGTFQRGYAKGELREEASKYFPFVNEIKGASGYRLVQCSHQPMTLC